MEKITAPFTPDQVRNINAYQQRNDVHPFTCPNHHGESEVILEATSKGFACPRKNCVYTQNWAHAMMAADKWSTK